MRHHRGVKAGVLSLFDADKDRTLRRYQQFVADGLSRLSPWSQITGQIFLGSPAFRERMAMLLWNEMGSLDVESRLNGFTLSSLRSSAWTEKGIGSSSKMRTRTRMGSLRQTEQPVGSACSHPGDQTNSYCATRSR